MIKINQTFTSFTFNQETDDSQVFMSFTKPSLVWHKARRLGHLVRIKLTSNVLLAKLTNHYTPGSAHSQVLMRTI